MGDEHLDTIPATESDEVIKSSVEDLVLIDISSSDDDSLHEENIEYVEASAHDSEVVSLEVAEIVIQEVKEIKDDNLREKLLNVHLLIANIEALKENPTQSFELLTKCSSTSLNSFLKETNTFHNSFLEFEDFYFDLGEISSGSTTTHSDISLSEYDSFIFDLTHEEFVDELAHIISPPEYDRFYFWNLPDPGELMSVLNSGIRKNLPSTTSVNLPIEDDYSPLLAYVVWIFVVYLTYPVIPPYLHPFGNEDTIFDPCITINHFYSFKPGFSHRHRAFKKFNTHHIKYRGNWVKHRDLKQALRGSIPRNLKTFAKGFYPPSLNLLSFNWESYPLIDHHCCYECGNSLNDFFFPHCTCEFCGNDAHVGYNCPTQVPSFQTLPSFPQQYPCCEDCGVLPEIDHSSQIVQKKQEEKRIEEEQATKAQNSKILACCDDDNDYNYAIIPNEPVDSLSIRDEHLNTIQATESDEFIKSCVEILVPNPSESEGENGCDVLACFTTFSNILFDAEYEFDSSDDQSLSDEDFPEEIFLNLLFEEEIISTKIDPHHFDAESDLIESMLNHDSSIISSSSKIDSILDEFAGELTLLKSITSRIDKTDCDHENEICLTKRLLYDNSSPRLPKEFVSENSDADIESFSPSPIPDEDSDSRMEEINLSFNSDDLMPPSIEEDDYDAERDVLIL
nr:hypothetical protein [Tanacetum cinerariifolium]